MRSKNIGRDFMAGIKFKQEGLIMLISNMEIVVGWATTGFWRRIVAGEKCI